MFKQLRGGINKPRELVNMIASVIKERRRKRSGIKGKGNGREDVLVISETRL